MLRRTLSLFPGVAAAAVAITKRDALYDWISAQDVGGLNEHFTTCASVLLTRGKGEFETYYDAVREFPGIDSTSRFAVELAQRIATAREELAMSPVPSPAPDTDPAEASQDPSGVRPMAGAPRL